jgi:hypothetical protein
MTLLGEVQSEERAPPPSLASPEDIVAALVNLWHGMTEEETVAASEQFNTLLREQLLATWERHAKKVPKKKKGKKRDAFKQAEDNINAVLGGLMKGK